MNKEVMMLHEFQTPPMSSNLSSLRKKIQKNSVYRPHAVFKNDIFKLEIYYIQLFNLDQFIHLLKTRVIVGEFLQPN